MIRLLDVAVELQLEIFSNLQRPDLCSLRSTCKHLEAQLTKQIFKEVKIRSIGCWSEVGRVRLPRPLQHVQSIRIPDFVHNEEECFRELARTIPQGQLRTLLVSKLRSIEDNSQRSDFTRVIGAHQVNWSGVYSLLTRQPGLQSLELGDVLLESCSLTRIQC